MTSGNGRTLPGRLEAAFHGAAAGRTDGALGAASFGVPRPPCLPAGVPHATVALPSLGGPGMTEIWSVAGTVHPAERDGIALGLHRDFLFGAATAAEEPGVPLEATARALYRRLFRCLDEEGFPHLLRIWNYFPRITGIEDGLERYRRFSLGRHEAFETSRRTVAAAPAATAIGSAEGPVTLLWIAAREPGRPVENPRQVSAYRYPPQYGPRSPTFSRATVGAGGLLFISGTAAIVGHESRHPGDVAAQTDETLANIEALVGAAGLPAGRRLLLKAYLRDPASRPLVEARLRRRFAADAEILFLQGEICRPELLVEIEGVAL